MKQLLSIEELIQHMKNRGITFNEISENDAKQFLQNNNYYMKLAAYRANYDKCLMSWLITESNYFIFNRWTITRSNSFN